MERKIKGYNCLIVKKQHRKQVLIKMFESLDTVRFMEMETIIHDILQFGGYNMDTYKGVSPIDGA